MKLISTTINLSILMMALTSCKMPAPVTLVTPNPARTILPTATHTPNPTNIATEIPVPTVNPFTLVETQDGKQFINNQYEFTITFPSDFEVFSTNDGLISGYLPQKHLDDGGDITTWIRIIDENQTDGCHPKLVDSDSKPVRVKQKTLGDNSYTLIYTPNLYGDYMQDIEYMTYDADLCVHFYINLTTHYFDQGSAIPGDMLPYVWHKLDDIISTFQWMKP